MKKDFQWAIWLFIIAVSILASSCGERRPTIGEQNRKARTTQDSVYKNTYPYEWDKITYNRRKIDGQVDSSRYNCVFHEEYVDIDHQIIANGDWLNKHTFSLVYPQKVTILITPITLVILAGDNQQEVVRYYKE